MMIIFLLLLLICSIILYYVNYLPFFYTFLLFAIFFCYKFIYLFKKNKSGLIYFNIALIFFLLALFELFLGINFLPVRYEIIEPGSKELIVKDPVRGYRAPFNAAIKKVEKQGDRVIFDVTYRTNKYGLRLAPHDIVAAPPAEFQKNIVFLGCSYTFGEGLEDHETLPYLLEERLAPQWRTYNFGFLGYGPHQMLHLLETGLWDKLLEGQKPDLVVYSAIMNHVERLAGAYPYILWDVEGPKYLLTPEGEVKHVGRFIDNPFHQDPRLPIRILNRWFLLNKTRVIPKIFKSQRTPEDLELFVKVIKRTDELVKEKYNAKFFILFWPDFQDKDYPSVVQRFQELNLKFITVDNIMKNYPDDPIKYVIDSYGHPSKLANEHLADFLIQYIRKN